MLVENLKRLGLKSESASTKPKTESYLGAKNRSKNTL